MEEQEERKISNKEFWIRFGIWITLAVIVPFVYIGFEYGILTGEGSTSTRLSGWGIIGVIFLCIMVTIVVSEAKRGLPYGNMFRQCIDGYSVLVWLLGFIMLIDKVKNNAESFEHFLIVVFVCECVAVPINPLRKWAEQNNIERGQNIFVRAMKKALGKDDANGN